MASLFDRHRQKQRTKKRTKSAKTNAVESAKGEPGVISKLSHDGRGVTRNADGKTVFVSGALPGEQVTYKVHTTRSRYDEAALDKLVSASDTRTTPFCPHFSRCGGCQLQHMQYQAQLTFKQQTIAEQFRHQKDLPFMPPLLMSETTETPGTGYRRKARLGVKWRKNGELHLGFREKQSHYVTPVSECKVLEPELEQLIAPLSQLLPKLHGKRDIGHIELILGEPDLPPAQLPHVGVVARLLKPLKPEDKQRWQEWADKHQVRVIADFGEKAQPTQFELMAPLHNSNAANSDEAFLFSYQVANKTLQFQPSDFIQVNRNVNRRMVAQALDWLEPQSTDRVLDLFSGFGNFTLPLAEKVAQVTAVEGIEAQVERGRENARLNSQSNVSFVCADLNHPEQLFHGNSCNVVLLDPPRAGAEQVVNALVNETLNSGTIEKILYVSCNPATLARDSELLEKAFRLKKISLMDMFSHTSHAETMALFERKS